MADLTKVRVYLSDAATGELIEAVDVRSCAAAVSTTAGSDVQTELDALRTAVGGDGTEGTSLADQITAVDGKADAAKTAIDEHAANTDVHVDKTKRDATVIDCALETKTGILTFTKYDGTTKKIDTLMEKIAVNFALNDTKDGLVITMDDGTTQEVSLANFINIYTGTTGPMIVVSVNETTKEISANLVDGSITMDKLSTEVSSAITAASSAGAFTFSGTALTAGAAAPTGSKAGDLLIDVNGNVYTVATDKTLTKLGTVSIPMASATADGLMSKEDYAKLQGIEEGANNYVLPSTLPATMIEEDDDHQFVTASEKEGFTGQMTYVDDIPTVNALGGIESGWTTDGMDIKDVMRKLLHPWVAPTVSAKIVPTNGGTVETGTTQSVTGISVTVTKKSANISKIEIVKTSATGTVLATLTEGVTNGGTFTIPYTESVTSNVTYQARVTDAEGKVTTANTGSFSFVYPYYYGAQSADTEVTEASVLALTKKVEAKGNKGYTFTCDNSCAVFAYPASYGTLSKILDQSSFDCTATFARTQVTINGTAYYVYKNSASTVTNFKFTFSY